MMLVSLSCGFVLVEIFRYEHLFYFIYQGMIKGYSAVSRLGEATSIWDVDSLVSFFYFFFIFLMCKFMSQKKNILLSIN